MKTFKIISADIITKKGTTPFVGLTVDINGVQKLVARTCAQALLDLHKSARGSNIPSGVYENGVDKVNPTVHNNFRSAIISLVGKTGFGDIEFYEAGTDYEVTDVSSAYKAGTAKLGEILKTEKAGSRVEGFLNFPLTDLETAQQRLIDSNPSLAFQMLFGITVAEPIVAPMGTTKVGGIDAIENEVVETTIDNEVFGEQEPEVVAKTKGTK